MHANRCIQLHKAFIHNAKVIFPPIAIFIENCHSHPARLFILGGGEIRSSEGTTQEDPIAMLIYVIAIIPFLLCTVFQIEETTRARKQWRLLTTLQAQEKSQD